MRTRRLLPYEEWHKLSLPVKACFGADKEPPHPMFSIHCAVEEEDGEIKGFLFLQLVPHLEPFGSLGGASFSGLKKVIDDALTNSPNVVYYIHTDNVKGEQVFAANDFNEVGVLFRGAPKVS